ncbi:uncharacterized protein LOC110191098 isoform X1 [Drosophila serrata]|uniref:uncharacterized protein LOC110191098 isoform X1 n=2 Tax=Drosophila serrata TaxID=7274 RepID=UPI000A1D3A41|nr:uncharacterized protein LOC110191098 isoform X1 [Drosophila serrata]
MEKIPIVIKVIGLFLSTSHLLVQTLPIKYHERNSKNETPSAHGSHQSLQIPLKPADDAGHGPSVLNGTVGLVMFPKSSEGGNRLHPIWKKSKINIFPHFTRHNEPGGQSNNNSTVQTEMTISVPELRTDVSGNIVFDKWFATNGDSQVNSRVKEYYRGSPSTVKFRAPERPRMYSPGHRYGLSTVCRKRSTVYNVPNIFLYLKPRIYNRVFSFRAVWMDLREEIWKEGNSQECHQANMTDWWKYINCAIRRNMRMDYLVPMYPLHQQGYYFHPDIKFYRYVK